MDILFISVPGGRRGRHWGLCVATARCLPARHSSPFVPAARPPPLPPHRKVPVGPASFLCLRCEWAHHGQGGQGGLGDFSSSRAAFRVGRALEGMGLLSWTAVCLSVCLCCSWASLRPYLASPWESVHLSHVILFLCLFGS